MLMAFLSVFLCNFPANLTPRFSIASALSSVELSYDRFANGFGEKELEKKQKEKLLTSFWAKEIDKKEEITQKLWNHEFEEHIALRNFLWDLSLDCEIDAHLANRWLRLRHLQLRGRPGASHLSLGTWCFPP